MSNSEIKDIEESMKGARKLIALGDSLERLKSNRDFRLLVSEGYFEKEAVRLVHLKSNPGFQSPQMQDSVLKQIDAIGNLNLYFQTISQQAALARKSLEQDEEARDELLAEED